MLSPEPIAIIGSGTRFPGSVDTPSKLWDLLQEPRDLLKNIPAERRFASEAFYHNDPEHHGTTNVQASYFLDEDPAKFDNGFFNIQPSESEAIDPQQRMLMETVYDSLCAAGQTIEGLRGSSTAVIVGLMGDDWSGLHCKDWATLPQYGATGMGRSIMSNRVSYFFDWHGPSITLDTACSSSLVAVHLAVQALRNGESRVAIAAGSNLILSPSTYIAESNLHMLSPTGRSRMWDKDVDGYARGEGVAAIVLKTLSAAIQDGDHIESIIRATGVNQDGKTSGLTMPSAVAQAALIRETYARAGLDINKPEDRPQFFHAHGTGTPAGDPQEAEAISKAFYSNGATDKLYVGSLKTIIGHTEGTAGLASLIGTYLALQHGVIPPNMHFNNINPRVAPFYTNLEIPTSKKPWPALLSGAPRRASVNSFGFGGTNAHAIIEAYEPAVIEPSTGPLYTPLTISAASEKSLRAMLLSYSAYLKANPHVSLRDFAFTLQERRSTLPYRTTIAASTCHEAVIKMDAILESEESSELNVRHFAIHQPRILAVFTGQGAQWPRMGAKLVESSSFVSKRLDELDYALSSLPEADRPTWTLREELLADKTTSRLAEAALSQPLCTAVQILLVDLLKLANITLSAVVGHSSGEIGAAYAAGVLSGSGAICIAYYRGLHANLAKSPNGNKGAMLAVGTSFEDASDFCQLDVFQGRLQVAARNSSSSTTLSGDDDAVDEALEIFKDEGLFARKLKVDTAYHSAHMLPCSASYLGSLEGLNVYPTATEDPMPVWYSSVYEGQLMSQANLESQYWVDNMTNSVLFAPAVTAVTRDGQIDLVLEIGPHAALKGPCLDTLEAATGRRIPYIGMFSREKDDVIELSTALGFVWSCLGAGSVTFEAFEKLISGDPVGRHIVPNLPKYPFDHSKSFWSMSRVSGAHTIPQGPPHPILGRRCVERETAQEVQWRNILNPKEISWLKGHKIQEQIIFPAAGFISMVVEAMKVISGRTKMCLITIENLIIGRALAFKDENSSMETLFSVKITQRGSNEIRASFSCYSGGPHEVDTLMGLNAEGSVVVVLGEPEAGTLPFVKTETFNMAEIEVDRFYQQFTSLAYEYSAPFHGMLSIKRKNGYATGTLEDQSDLEWEDQLLVHPGMLDTALQASSAAFSCPGDGRMWGLYIPAGIKSIIINPYFTSDGIGKQKNHPWEAAVTGIKKARSIVDFNIFSEDSPHTFVQVEGLELVLFTAARPEDDTVLFSRFDYKIDRPNGDIATKDDGLSAEDIKNALKAERVSYYYLRHLHETITPQEKANTLPHYQRLLDWAAHVVGLVKSGKNPHIPSRYQLDTAAEIDAILENDRDRVDVRLLESVGKNLPEVIRTNSGILEHLTNDGLFDFYDQGLGLDVANRHFARMVAQLAHTHPRMNIFEIGAGTGGSTRNILPALGQSFSSYTYTDISSGFFEAAQDRFKEFGSRIVYNTFDMERTPASQNFTEGHYDLVLASNVLHATDNLEKMMMHVRQLLKPGGYLIALELTSNDTLRVGLPMGSLPGWWIGAGNGRPWGPSLTLLQWDSLLRKCGFGGVDTSTPPFHKLNPSSVFSAQAVDPRINLLRSPLSEISVLPQTDSSRIVIVGGQTLTSHRIAEKVAAFLATRYTNVLRVSSIEDLDTDVLVHSSTVLSLTELDEPIFRTFTPEKFDALKTLWRQAGTVLWVTRMSRTEEPHSFMTLGLGRVMRFEYPNISLQMLDFDELNEKTAQIITEELLRLEILKKWEKEVRPGEYLWSIEPEVYFESGTRIIPRLYKSEEANERYNTCRRKVMKVVDTQESPIVFSGEDLSYELQYPSPLSLPTPPPSSGHTRTIHLSHFLLQMIDVAAFGYLMLCTGRDEETGDSLLTLASSAESRVTVLADWTLPIGDADPSQALLGVAAHIVAANILSLAPCGSTLVVHEPDLLVGISLIQQAPALSVSVVITTSQKKGVARGWHYIHTNLPQRHLKKILPTSPSMLVDLSQAPGSAQVGYLVRNCVPQSCAIYDMKNFYATTTFLRPGSSINKVNETLNRAWAANCKTPIDVETAAPLSTQDIPSFSMFESPLVIADCSSSSVSVNVQPIDSGVIFRADKTYFLVGLSGDLGQSLCQWMVEHGARHIALASRRPKVCSEFIESMRAMGANIRVLSLDITKRDSLSACHKIISTTMPPIAGVANGAMVLQDSLFEKLSFDTITKVMEPKVVGTQLLDELFHDDQLEFFIVFSSLTCLVGNSGQSSYIAANMFMTALAAQRKKRGVSGSSIAISSLMGIGYVERSEEFTGDYFAKLGYRNISEQDLHQLFAEAILVGRPECQENAEIATGLEPIFADSNVKAQFRTDIKFNHFIKERPDTQNHTGKLSTMPVRVQLAEARTVDQANLIIKSCFVARLKRILMISPDDSINETVSLVEQGVDSLMSVEVRSWFLQELEVDLPVLKILGGSSIMDLLHEAMLRVPKSVVDLDLLDEDMDEVETALVTTSQSPPVDVKINSSDDSSENEGSPWEKLSLSDTSLEASMITEKEEIAVPKPTEICLDHERKVEEDIQAIYGKEETCAMSYGQSRFWFLNDYLENKKSFNMTVMFKLTGKMQVSLLEKAVQTLAQRHEALRTRFFWSGDDETRIPTQGVLPRSPMRLVHKRLDSEANVQDELQKMHDHHWDLNDWEAARISLLSVGEDVHFLLVGGHHISWDGYSFTVLFIDLEAAYSGRVLPPLPLESQYRSFTLWQQEQYQKGAMKNAIDYYRGIISADPPAIPLFPFAKSQTRPLLDRFDQFEAKARLEPELVSKLKLLARKNRSTMFHLYLAALQALVFRLLPDIEEFYLGFADANRIEKRFMGSLGFFLNLLPMHFTRGQANTKISNIIKDTRDKAFIALEHSFMPWNVLLDELKVPRSDTHAPIFQLFVDYRQIFQERSIWGGCKLSDEQWMNAKNGYDLTLGITDNPTGESYLSLRFQQKLYSESSTNLFMRSYVNVLESFANGVDLPVHLLPAWDPKDIKKAFEIGRGPELTLQWPTTVSHRVDQMVLMHTNKPALKDGLGNTLTYGEMGARINTIAEALIAVGVTSKMPVGVFQDPSADWICSMLAIFRTGATYIPLDLRNSIPRLVSIVTKAQPLIIITDDNTTTKTKLIGASHAIELNVSKVVTSNELSQVPNRAEANSPAVVLFTSGSTGEPKGVIMNHSNLAAECEAYSTFCNLPAGNAVVMQQSIFSFDFSIEQTFVALADGGCLYIVSADKRGDPQEISKLMVDEGITYTSGTPSEYEMMFKYAFNTLAKCKTWKYAFGGGEYLSSSLIRQFAMLPLPQLRLFNNYGPAEVTTAALKGELKYRDTEPEEQTMAGYVLPNYKLYFVDKDLQPVPVGVPGEIVVGGPGVTVGYLGMEEMTKSHYINDTFCPTEGSNRLYRTGDRGRLQENGAVYWESRIEGDTQVKLRGFRIELTEIETILMKHSDGALSHAVVTARGLGEDRFLVAHVVFTPQYPHEKRRDIIKFLESKLPLPSYMQPSLIIPLAELPLTAHSKLDRRAIQTIPLPERSIGETNAATRIEQELAELWRRVIPHDVDLLATDTNFFDVGGNSILLVKLQSLIKETMNSAPPLIDLMSVSTLGGMARSVKFSAVSTSIDWTAETCVPQFIESPIKRQPRTHSRCEDLTVILAGATGYLGRHVLSRLIDAPQVREIRCLVRKNGNFPLPANSSPKVKLINADLSQANLGLSAEEFLTLGANVDVVLNCAANRSFWDGYEALKAVNVDAVKNLAHLCIANNASFHMLSSGAVQTYGLGSAPPVDGTDGYVASKWAAETFLGTLAVSHELQVYIHRPLATPSLPKATEAPSNVSVSAVSILNELLDIAQKLGRTPDFSSVRGSLDVIPIEEVVTAIMASILAPSPETSGARIVEHEGRLQVSVQDFAGRIEKDAVLSSLPTMNPLHWFGEAKMAGFGYFMSSHHLVMKSQDGEVVTKR